MAPRGTFSYRNLDSTADLNLRFQNLVAKGIYSGGRLSATGGSFTVTVSPYMAMTNEGMMVSDSENTNVTVNGSILQYVVIDATYNPSGNALINVLAVPQTQYTTYKNKYICIGIVDMSAAGGGFVASQYISYTTRDQVTPVVDSKFLGYFTTEGDRASAFPSTAPFSQRIGDFSIIGNSAGTLKFGFWAGTAWVDFVNPGSVATALADHIANNTVNAKHVSDAEKAALSGTYGTPSGVNKYITESDSRVLTNNERQALANAVGLGGGLGQTNPLVAKATVIAVPRVFQVNIPLVGNTVVLSAGVLGIPAFDVYLGKQGIEALTNTSSAKQYFAVEDEYGNGYVSALTGLPVYITDVYDAGGTTLNPDNVCSNEGFFITAGANIQLKLSTNVSASTRVFIRLNLRGDISALTPNWPGSGNTFLPAITAFRYGKQSFISALQSEFASLLVGNAAAQNPNTLISTSSVGTVTSVNQTYRHGITDVAGIVVHTGSAYTGNIDVTGNQWWFKATTGTGEVIMDNSGLLVSGPLGIYSAGFGAQLGGFDSFGRVIVGSGDVTHPGIKFVENDACGIYYLPNYVAPASGYNLNVIDGIGFVINQKTAFLIGRDGDTTGITDMDCPLILLQSYTAGTVSYIFGINDNTGVGGAVPGHLSFGAWDGNRTHFVAGLDINFTDSTASTDMNLVTRAQIHGKNSALIGDDEALPAYSFRGATNTGMFYVDSWSNTTNPNQFLNGIGFSVNGHAALIVTRDASVGPSTITGVVANPLILNQHSDGANIFYDFAIADAYESGEGNGLMRFGYVNYVGVFTPVMAVNGEVNNIQQVEVYGDLNAVHAVRVGNFSVIRDGSVQFSDISQGISSEAGNLIIGSNPDAYISINSGTHAIDVYGDVHIYSVTGSAKLMIGGSGITSTLRTNTNVGFLFGYESSSSDTKGFAWGFGTTPMGLLSTSGKVFGARVNSAVTYGFFGMSGVGIGTDVDSNLVLHGNVTSTFLNTTTLWALNMSLFGTANVNNLNVSGVFGITNLSIPGTATIANANITNAVVTDEVVTRLSVGNARASQPTPPYVQPDQTVIVGEGGNRRGNENNLNIPTGGISAESVDAKEVVVNRVYQPRQRTWYVQPTNDPTGPRSPIIMRLGSRASVPTSNSTTFLNPLGSTSVITDGTPTLVTLDSSIKHHHIHYVSRSTALPANQTGTPTAMDGANIIDYGPNSVIRDGGAIEFKPWFCLAIQLDADGHPTYGPYDQDEYTITITTSNFLNDMDYVDLIDQTLAHGGPGASSAVFNGNSINRWNTSTPGGYNVTGFTNPWYSLDPDQNGYIYDDGSISNTKWCKFARYTMADRTSLYPGGYPGSVASGMEITLVRAQDGLSNSNLPGTNWNSYIKRFGR